MEGLEIPENGNAEEEDAADVEDHGHLRFSVAVEHAEDGGIDGEGEYGERVVSVDRLDQDEELGGAVGKLVLVIEADNGVLEYKTDKHVADDAENACHHEGVAEGPDSALVIAGAEVLADDGGRALLN